MANDVEKTSASELQRCKCSVQLDISTFASSNTLSWPLWGYYGPSLKDTVYLYFFFGQVSYAKREIIFDVWRGGFWADIMFSTPILLPWLLMVHQQWLDCCGGFLTLDKEQVPNVVYWRYVWKQQWVIQSTTFVHLAKVVVWLEGVSLQRRGLVWLNCLPDADSILCTSRKLCELFVLYGWPILNEATLCTMKAELRLTEPGLIRWIFYENWNLPQSSIDPSVLDCPLRYR